LYLVEPRKSHLERPGPAIRKMVERVMKEDVSDDKPKKADANHDRPKPKKPKS